LVSATTILTGWRKEPPLFSQLVSSTGSGTSPSGREAEVSEYLPQNGVQTLRAAERTSVARSMGHPSLDWVGGYFGTVSPAFSRWIAGIASLWDLRARLAEGRLRRVVLKALALKPRGFIPHDVLVLTKLSGQLQVEWRARDIHPWDLDQSRARQAELFREQVLRDTDEAVIRLFQILPEIDAIDIRVFAPRAVRRLMLAGTVSRREAFIARPLASPGMRLKVMGVRYQVANGHLDPLE